MATPFFAGFCRRCRDELNSLAYLLESAPGEPAARARLALRRSERRLRQLEFFLLPQHSSAARRYGLAGMLDAVVWLGSLLVPPLDLRWKPEAFAICETCGQPAVLGAAVLRLARRWQQEGAAAIHLALDPGHRGGDGTAEIWLELLPSGITADRLAPRAEEARLLAQAGALGAQPDPACGLRIRLPQTARLRRPAERRHGPGNRPRRLLVLSADPAFAQWLRDRLGRQRTFCIRAGSWHEARLLLTAREHDLVVYEWCWAAAPPGAVVFWLLRHRPERLPRLLILTDAAPQPGFLALMERYGLIWREAPLTAVALEQALSQLAERDGLAGAVTVSHGAPGCAV